MNWIQLASKVFLYEGFSDDKYLIIYGDQPYRKLNSGNLIKPFVFVKKESYDVSHHQFKSFESDWLAEKLFRDFQETMKKEMDFLLRLMEV